FTHSAQVGATPAWGARQRWPAPQQLQDAPAQAASAEQASQVPDALQIFPRGQSALVVHSWHWPMATLHFCPTRQSGSDLHCAHWVSPPMVAHTGVEPLQGTQEGPQKVALVQAAQTAAALQ